MFIKKLLATSLMTLGITLPFSAIAGDLHLWNYVNLPSTTLINDMACSSILGEKGKTKPCEKNHVVDDATLRNKACFFNIHDCKADLYMTNDCLSSGKPKIATVYFDVDTGLKENKTQIFDPSYTIEGS